MEDEKLKHLEFIQSVISRLTTNSFMLKGWSITLITGLLALSVFADAKWMVLFAILPVVSFWGLDAYYLHQEKLFRELYDHSRKSYINNDKSFDLLSMDPKPFGSKVKSSFYLAFSKTIFWFHGILSVLVIAEIVYIICFKK